MASLLGSIPQLVTEITRIALSDPLSAISVAVGSAFIGLSVLAFGYLVLGAVADAVLPDLSSREPPRQVE
jgi:hypothetical protein